MNTTPPTGWLTVREMSDACEAHDLTPFDFQRCAFPLAKLPAAERERLEAKSRKHGGAIPATVTRWRLRASKLQTTLPI